MIPIRANSKEPLCSWGSMPSSEQWREVGGERFRGNIATILGNGFAVLDADNQQAADNLSAWLDGMGISSPVVQTPSGGKHFWLRLADAPADVSYKLLSPEVGAGELRVSNCYVLAPCSSIGEVRYRFEFGNPEAIASLRSVSWQDLLELLPGAAASAGGAHLESLPVRLLKREMPSRAVSLFSMLRDAPKSEPVDGERYATRSEAEAAIMALLILSGWQKSDISEVFDAEQPGHYADITQRSRYLDLTYRNVLSDIATTPERVQLAELYSQAQQWQWRGRGGLLSLAVYRAVLAIGYQFASYTVSASERDIAEHSAASRRGVQNALKRLSEFGLLCKLQPGDSHRAALWQINFDATPQKVAISHSIKQKEQRESSSSDVSEIWSLACLGRSAGVVYSRLSGEGVSIGELAAQTGKAWATVRAALRRLAQHELAEQRDGLWYLGGAQVLTVAEEFDTERLAERRHERHERERLAWYSKREQIFQARAQRRLSARSRRRFGERIKAPEHFREPAERLAEQTQHRFEQRWLAGGGGGVVCAAPVREVLAEMPRAPDKPVYTCPVCGGMSWAQSAPGLRWHCVDCRSGRERAERISSDITAEQAARLMALLQRFERESRGV